MGSLRPSRGFPFRPIYSSASSRDDKIPAQRGLVFGGKVNSAKGEGKEMQGSGFAETLITHPYFQV